MPCGANTWARAPATGQALSPRRLFLCCGVTHIPRAQVPRVRARRLPSRSSERIHGLMAQDPPDDGRDSRDEIYSKRVPAGRRTYFFDVKTTRSGEDFFLTITESKRVDEGRWEKHKVFLYKEDFGKFAAALHEAIDYIRENHLPDYDFRDLPEVDVRYDEADVRE